MYKLLILMLISSISYGYELQVGTGGFLGKNQFGFGSKNLKLIYAFGKQDQLSVKYDTKVYKSLYFGTFITRCQCSNTFVESPSKYNDKNYYPITQYRAGLSFGLKFKYFYINTNINDQGLILMFNEKRYQNPMSRGGRMLWSTGLGLTYGF